MNIQRKMKLKPGVQSKQLGITLIEVLVTVLILAIGGLGIASMQLAGLKYTNGAYARTQSVILANDMINKIQSNRTFALDLNNDGTFGNNEPYTIPTFGSIITSTKDCTQDECDTQELADYDLSTWLDEVARVLPAGRGRITLINQPNAGITERQFNISLQWREVANSSDQDATQDSELKSVTYRVTI